MQNVANMRDRDRIGELSCNLDDMSGEEIAFAVERLMAAGARDVFTIPAGMKKSRPGTVLTVLCDPERMTEFEKQIFALTTTIGIRETIKERAVLRRREEVCETSAGRVRVKVSEGYGCRRVKAEADDLMAAAESSGRTVSDIRDEAESIWRSTGRQRENGSDRS